MKYLIAGLGNIGSKYTDTRHNAGFLALDTLAAAFGARFETESMGDVATLRHKGRTLVLLKPSTYMNLSGKAVRYWLQKAGIPKEQLLVVVDDIHLPFGQLRLRLKGSDAGHNGLKSVEQLTGGQDYARLRIGIGNQFHKSQQVDYVLGEWTAAERDALPGILDKAAQGIQAFCTLPAAQAMSQVN